MNCCRACQHDGIFYLDMSSQDVSESPDELNLDELNITKYLEKCKELHALSDVDKSGFEIDNILPLGTTG